MTIFEKIFRKNKQSSEDFGESKYELAKGDITPISGHTIEVCTLQSTQQQLANTDMGPESTVHGGSPFLLTSPRVLTWKDKDAYVYTVTSATPGTGPGSDVEFVICIPIDTAVQWFDATKWGKDSKDEFGNEIKKGSLSDVEGRMKGKPDGSDGRNSGDGKVDSTSKVKLGVGEGDGDGKQVSDKDNDKNQKKNSTGSEEERGKNKPDQSQGKDKAAKRAYEDTKGAENTIKLKKPRGKNKTKQDGNDNDESAGRKNKVIGKAKPRKEPKEGNLKEFPESSSFGPTNLFLSNRPKNVYADKNRPPHPANFNKKIQKFRV